ncbi:MAG TPA: ATP phosphoribosyltransferase [Clostridiales bacterium]|nr:ATP phosphoribosyltransferase [Clostridiales bacterium]
MLTVALAKGRLAKYAIELFEKCGIDASELKQDTRKLVVYDKSGEIRFVLVKPSDVPVYVYRGVADIGIAGKDTLLEAGLPLYEMLDLKFAACKICVAGYENKGNATRGRLRVATKYPRVAKMFYDGRGEDIEIIKLNGSIELAPILDLSDVIVDIVESGGTLRENGLSIHEDVCGVSARLVVNQVSLKTKADVISPLISKMKKALEEV